MTGMSGKEGESRTIKENRRRIRLAASALLALGASFALPFFLNLKGELLAVSNSFISVCFFGVIWFLLYRCLTQDCLSDRRGLAASGVLSLLFCVCLNFGAQLEREENVDFLSPATILPVLAGTAALTVLIRRLWELLRDREEGRASVSDDRDKGQSPGPLCLAAEGESCVSARDGDKEQPPASLCLTAEGESCVSARDGDKEQPSVPLCPTVKGAEYRWTRVRSFCGKHRGVLTAVLIFLAWIPVFLAVYPGFFVYDAQDELTQVITRSFTTHHPLPHVLLMGGTVLFFHKLTGSYNTGIAAYTLFQMAALSGVFAYTARWLLKRKTPRACRALTVLYYALFPVIVMFALCSAKDGIFTAALLLLLLLTADMARERAAFFSSWKKPLACGMAAVTMMSFRHNGMYAFLVFVPFLLLCMKGFRKKAAVLLGTSLAVYFALNAGLAAAVGAGSSGHQEMLTVPIQQLARVWHYERDSFSEEELAVLYEILPEKALSFYTPRVSDGVKVSFNNEAFEKDPGKYAGLWFKTGCRHPFTYLNAWLMTSYGFWYPDTVIDVYRGNSVFTFTYGDSSFFGWEVEEPGTRKSLLPALNEWYRRLSLEITQQKIPVLSMLFSPGFLFFVYAFMAGYAYYRRKKEWLPFFLLLLLTWLTVLLGPTYLPRYVLILWFALPVLPAVVNRP